jgi:putative endonuclease
MREREYFVYVMANLTRTLYVGVTGDLYRRVAEHKDGSGGSFTSRYRLDRLVYAESTSDVQAALAREKQLKGWRRSRKIELIESVNPEWRDLSAGWGTTDSSLGSA